MTVRTLILRGLTYYWRTNVAVVAGVATAVAVLAGALVVGDSVRGTLYDLAIQRLGATDLVVTSSRFFREALADDLRRGEDVRARFADVAPLIAVPGVATDQLTGQRARVLVYGVDDRFWQLHGVASVAGPGESDAFVSPAVAAEIGLAEGRAVLVRVERPSDVPLESLHGRRDVVGRTLRLTVNRVLAPEALGEFSLQPRQGEVRAVFVPLGRLQAELAVQDRVNALLAVVAPAGSGVPVAVMEQALGMHVQLADVGMKLQALPERGAVSAESDAGLLDAAQVDAVHAAIESTMLEAQPVFTYLANTLQTGSRSIPYSLVAAVDLQGVARGVPPASDTELPPIVLNDWAARDLRAGVGDLVRLDYYVWDESGQLATETAEFRLAGVVPVNALDRDLAPSYPGITDSPTLDEWDPPFPIDLRRVRRVDEAYWDAYRTTPKAFIPFEVGQRLWSSRYGIMTSLRFRALEGQGVDETVAAFDERLRTKTDPIAFGMSVFDARGAAIAASTGVTDFGEYFLYFSFFLVVAAVSLAALFFKLGVEQRAREVGLLDAVGVDAATVRRLLMGEAVVLALTGSLVGAAGAVGYAGLIVAGLGTWWVDAVGTTALTVHVSPLSLVVGAVGGVTAAMACTWWTLRGLSALSARSLLAGDVAATAAPVVVAGRTRRVLGAAVACLTAGVLLVGLAAADAIDGSGAFFGAGSALLVSALCFYGFWYRRAPRRLVHGRGWRPVARLGLRNASYRPGRSVLSIGVIASATFILIAVDAFRHDQVVATGPQSGVGDYELVMESLLPIAYDLGTPAGRQALNLSGLEDVSFEPFRLRPGDDASCLNLYAPQNPRILGARAEFLAAGRFGFHSSLAETDDERANPWLILERRQADGAVPVIADINSMTYVLHRALGEEIVISSGGRSIRLRLVAALRDSIFQSELLMSEGDFRMLFPDREGYQVLLVDAPAERASSVTAEMENALADFGADVTATSTRLAEFHKVENAYLSTFQMLGGLGLLVGTVGLAAVLLRNALERRRELALLGAVGFRRRQFVLMLSAESLSWLAGGLIAGGVSAAVAIAPALAERGGRLPVSTSGALLVFAVFVVGVVSTVVAARLATRGSLLQALRSE